MKTIHSGLAGAVALLLSAAALGATPAAGDAATAAGAQAGTGQLGSTERTFVEDAASAGMFEVQAARLAESKAQDPQVQSYARQMLTDHQQNNRTLMQIARAKGVTPPTQLEAKHQAMLSRLERASGKDFDKEYGQVMDQSHADTVRMFERGRQQVTDTELKSYIAQTLPTLERHHSQAGSLPGAAGGSTRQASSDDAAEMGTPEATRHRDSPTSADGSAPRSNGSTGRAPTESGSTASDTGSPPRP
jgi:putative membrane protein